MAGILVSLINTGLVLAFIGIPGITDGDDVQIVEVAAGADGVTDARVAELMDELGATIDRLGLAAGSAPSAAGTLGAGSLDLVGPRFARVLRPAFVSASGGVAWVTARNRFELSRVDLRGRVESESLDGIEDLGESAVADVDVTADGTLYALVRDGAFEWRLFLRFGGGEWALLASSELSRWPAEVAAVSVAESGNIYLAASQPAGLFRLVAPFDRVSDWVPGQAVQGVDTAGDESLQLYAAPQNTPLVPAEQVGFSRGGSFGAWQSEYAPCAAPSGGQQDAAVVPQFPRDVAIVDAVTALIADSLNHVIRLQREDGAGEVVFGVPCEQGRDERHLLNPSAVAIDEQGNVFIADSGNNRVVVLAVQTEAEPAAATPLTSGAIEFGLPGACPPSEPRCAAGDRLQPIGTRVTAGEAVDFNINAIAHQVAVYGPGTRVANIDTAILGGVAETDGADRTIMDPNGRVAASPDLPFAPDGATAWTWDTTGVVPGTYLIICTFQPHFEVGMYGWVIVR